MVKNKEDFPAVAIGGLTLIGLIMIWLAVIIYAPRAVESELERLSYTDIQVDGTLSFKCQDNPAYSFSSLNSRSERVTGVACYSFVFGVQFYFD